MNHLRTIFARLSPWLLLALLAVPTAADDTQSGGWMGVLLQTAQGAKADLANGEIAGVLVTGVIEDSPAADVGLRAQDRILTVDGTPVTGVRELMARLRALEPDAWVSLEVDRGGRDRDMRLRLGERPGRDSRIEMRRGWIGITAIELPPALREHFGAPEEAGVMISAIEEGSPAQIAGIELGDVVYRVEGLDITSYAELKRRIVRGGIGNTLEIEAARGGVEIVLEALVDREPEEEVRGGRRDPSGGPTAPRGR
ncbi:hypothetical protein ABI59_08715 [Acidobacteria bacterium Mor1]|nr:hypothetical protein ABI59_08715 [Acidobacteria bacterium Mor1]